MKIYNFLLISQGNLVDSRLSLGITKKSSLFSSYSALSKFEIPFRVGTVVWDIKGFLRYFSEL